MRVFVCSTNRVFSGEKKLCVCSTNLGFSMIPGTYYVPDTYVPGISRHKSIRTYVMFRPWTHTSDDSYIYQLSLVVATATVSYIYIRTYADLTFLFLSEVYDLVHLLCIIFCFYLLSSSGNFPFPLQSYWSLSCYHGRHCSDELM